MSSSPILFVTIGGSLFAIHAKTGAIAWETSIGAGRAQLAVHQDRVYVVSEFNSLLTIIHAQDGSRLCEVNFSGSGQAPTILIDHEQVFVSSGGELHAFDLNGALLWTHPFKGKGNGALALATIYKDRQADEY